MDRGAWQATVLGVAESGMTEQLSLQNVLCTSQQIAGPSSGGSPESLPGPPPSPAAKVHTWASRGTSKTLFQCWGWHQYWWDVTCGIWNYFAYSVCVCVCVCMEKGMATHSSILAWRITWTEELGGLQSVGSQRVRHDGSDLARISVCISTYIGTYTEW